MDRIRALQIWLAGILLFAVLFYGNMASAQEEVASAFGATKPMKPVPAIMRSMKFCRVASVP